MRREANAAQKDESRVLQQKVLALEAIWQGGQRKGFKQEDRAHFHFLKGYPVSCPAEQGLWGRHGRYSGVESSVGHLNRMVREKDGERSTDLRLEGGRTVWGEGLVREGDGRGGPGVKRDRRGTQEIWGQGLGRPLLDVLSSWRSMEDIQFKVVWTLGYMNLKLGPELWDEGRPPWACRIRRRDTGQRF